MNRTTIFVLGALITSLFVVAQTGSGTLNFSTEDNQTLPISGTATSLFGAGEYVHNFAGNTGENIAFFDWPLVTLGVNDVDITDNRIMGPTSKELNAYMKLNNPQNARGQLFNLLGQKVANLQTTEHGNGFTQFFYNANNLADGIYVAQIQSGNQQGAFKVLLAGKESDGVPNPFPQRLSNKFSAKNSIASRGQDTNIVNYAINTIGDEINTFDQDIEVTEIENNSFGLTVVPKNGDTAVVPQLNGSPIENTTITLINQTTPQHIYSVDTQNTGETGVVFENIFVSSPDNPDLYEINITSNDGIFLPTTVTENMNQDIFGENNGVKTIEVTPIPNEVDLTTIIRHYQTSAVMPGVTIELRNGDTDALIDTQVSDTNGAVTFMDVAGNTPVYTINYKGDNSIYKKTNESITTDLVVTIAEMTDTINTTAVPKVFFADATQVPIEEVMAYKVNTYNVEFLRGSDEIYLADSPEKPIMVGHLQGFAAGVGFPNGFDFSATQPFNDPTADQINQYQIFAPNRVTFDGLVGTNASPGGTATTNDGKVADNGKVVYFWSPTFRLGGTQENSNHHEAGNKLGVPFRPGLSSRNPNAGESVPLTELDGLMIKLWYNIGNNIYIQTDSQNRPLDYSHTNTLEN
ncbi:MAG: T9SS type A sorting domain-containing protein [Flavobacteriaceae bacterium]|nr:T9SS type A sorting domain-containing protein [Flavobacteriaceae bacterium]